MLDLKFHSQFVEATVDMMRACALASARAASAPMFQGMFLWSQVMRASSERAAPAFPAAWALQSPLAWNPLDGWAAWGRVYTPSVSVPPSSKAEQPAEPPAIDPAFASYRSSGGHAVAQVIVA